MLFIPLTHTTWQHVVHCKGARHPGILLNGISLAETPALLSYTFQAAPQVQGLPVRQSTHAEFHEFHWLTSAVPAVPVSSWGPYADSKPHFLS